LASTEVDTLLATEPELLTLAVVSMVVYAGPLPQFADFTPRLFEVVQVAVAWPVDTALLLAPTALSPIVLLTVLVVVPLDVFVSYVTETLLFWEPIFVSALMLTPVSTPLLASNWLNTVFADFVAVLLPVPLKAGVLVFEMLNSLVDVISAACAIVGTSMQALRAERTTALNDLVDIFGLSSTSLLSRPNARISFGDSD
jgi:hypothetical protein